MFKQIAARVLRAAFAILVSYWSLQWAGTDLGLLLAPALMGIAKSIRAYYRKKGKAFPWWVKKLPF